MRKLFILALCLGAVAVQGLEPREELRIDEITIIGKAEDASKIAGSAYVITEWELEKFEYGDIHRIIRQVPGVYFQEEDGFGLRPNIGIRGSGSGRNSKITVMEDGILIAPAPYADPAAYYFPATARIAGVEVLKGPQALRHGPFTVGGALNLLSTRISDEFAGFANIELGQRGEMRNHLGYGGTAGQWGFLLETLQHKADGFHNIDRSNRDTGFGKEDYVAKLRWRSAAVATVPQQLDIKLNYAEETSNSSYLGVTDAQFKRDPHRRYGITELDQMNFRHKGVSLRHSIEFNDSLALATTLYRHEFSRSWFRVNRIGGQSLGAIITDANNGNANAIAILEGAQDVNDVLVKDNARDYVSEGLQFELSGSFETGVVAHDWLAGLRMHRDESDRRQPTTAYNQVNGSLVFDRIILPGAGDNRVDEAEALSAWLLNRMNVGKLDITASLRFEDIETESTRYNDFFRSSVNSTRDNDADELMLGLGATYQLTERWQLLAGIHQGFAPAGAGAAQGTNPEESLNYEFGLRYRSDRLGADMIAFYSDYENTVINCSVANPCSGGRDFGTESLGEAEVKGVELSVDAVLVQAAGYSIPLRAAYTYTDAEITRDSQTGNVLKGDNLPYLPKHVFNTSVGFEHLSGWNSYLSVSLVGEMCDDGLCERSGSDNRFRKTDDYWSVDLASSYPLSDSAEVYTRIDNLLDDESIVARSPSGARANKPRTVYIGVRLRF